MPYFLDYFNWIFVLLKQENFKHSHRNFQYFKKLEAEKSNMSDS